MQLAVIVPTYGHFDYALDTCRTCLLHTSLEDVVCLVVDDASKREEWDWFADHEEVKEMRAAGRLELHRFETNGGITRSWNWGVARGLEAGAKWIAPANSDLLFSPGWDEPLREALTRRPDLGLVGPITNAPGNQPAQQVANFLPGYVVTDDLDEIAKTAAALRKAHGSRALTSKVNGFCMVGTAEAFRRGAYDAEHAFRPENKFDSRGRPNPTPLMTLNEDELQARWRDLEPPLLSAIVPASFVFHYRAVSRGDKFKCPGWFRKKN